MMRYRWTIEFVPDNPEITGDELACLGTREEAKAYADRLERDYLCREIVFHRCGAVAATHFIALHVC